MYKMNFKNTGSSSTLCHAGFYKSVAVFLHIYIVVQHPEGNQQNLNAGQ